MSKQKKAPEGEQRQKEKKSSIRKKYLDKRNALTPEAREKASRKITERVLRMPEVASAPVVFLYASYRSEVTTKQLIQTLVSEGRTVALPKVEGETLVFYPVGFWEDLFPGYRGILEPQVSAGTEPVSPGPRDVMLLPGACFDYSGNRIGYGGGYYDRYLNDISGKKPVRIGLAFHRQFYPSVLPAEPQDVAVDYVVSERKTVKTEANKTKGYGIWGDILEFIAELVMELLDGIG